MCLFATESLGMKIMPAHRETSGASISGRDFLRNESISVTERGNLVERKSPKVNFTPPSLFFFLCFISPLQNGKSDAGPDFKIPCFDNPSYILQRIDVDV